MRLASYSPFALLVFAALGCAVACGDDDDSSGGTAGSSAGGENSAGGSISKAGSSTSAGSDAGGSGAVDSQLCMDLGGPANIDAVVRGDGKTSDSDPFNGFKFDHAKARQASVLLNVATDPCIGQQFASLLTKPRAAALEHLAECLSLFVQNAAGCAVEYDGAKDKAGEACKDMKLAHEGRGITEEDYTALVTDAATALIAAGVPADSDQFKAVAGALTADSLKKDVITSTSATYSQPAATCEAAAGASSGGAGGAGATP